MHKARSVALRAHARGTQGARTGKQAHIQRMPEAWRCYAQARRGQAPGRLSCYFWLSRRLAPGPRGGRGSRRGGRSQDIFDRSRKEGSDGGREANSLSGSGIRCMPGAVVRSGQGIGPGRSTGGQ